MWCYLIIIFECSVEWNLGWRLRLQHGWLKGHIAVFTVPSVTLQPLEWFSNNLAQMLSKLRWCVESMSHWPWHKFKVASWAHITAFPVHWITLQHLEWFSNNLLQMLTMLRWCAERMSQWPWLKFKVTPWTQRLHSSILFHAMALPTLEGF